MIDMNRRSLLIGGLALFAAPAIVRAASIMPIKAWRDPRTIYVRAGAPGLGNGTSWADAFTNIQEAILNIGRDDTVFIDRMCIEAAEFPKAKFYELSNCKINFGGSGLSFK